jgi:hypothetical protein
MRHVGRRPADTTQKLLSSAARLETLSVRTGVTVGLRRALKPPAADVAETIFIPISLRAAFHRSRQMAQIPLSGLYQGEMMLPQPGRFVLELRVDIDEEVVNSPVMRRVSGDLYQVTQTALPGQPPKLARTYIESWIIDEPQIERAADKVDVSGLVRFWFGTHPATTATLVITSPGSPPEASAEVTFTETRGAERKYHCRRSSAMFRKVNMEIDVCASVNTAPLLPEYDTSWHADRPPGLPQRVLTIESTYREAGVEVTIDPVHTVIDDAAPQFRAWTPALLHDAMETYYRQYGGTWPDWKMWGLMAGLFETRGVGGVMFDAASQFGGAGKAPERQGFAVFREHQWFNNLVNGTPANQDQAWAARHFLYTWVHEAGHAYNFLHSWDKGRPDSLSWMNYDWRYDQRNGSGNFWKRFAFRFDDDELIHLRHGNRSSVIMGGDPWSSGSHLETPNLAMAQIEGEAPLEFIIRSKQYFEFMEPVIVELRLRNLLPHTAVEIDKRLPPEYGGVVVYIQNPDDRVVQYDPVMCAVGTPDPLRLSPAGVSDGTDRYSREVFLTYGSNSFYFDRPGEYRIRAVYQGPGDVLIPSDTHRIRIGLVADKELDRKAQDYFTDSVGLALYLQGSRSPYLQGGTAVLEQLADRYKESALGTKIAMTLANGLSKPFFRIVEAPKRGTEIALKQTSRADPARALAMTAPALNLFRNDSDKSNNLAYSRLVLRRADYHRAEGDDVGARNELGELADQLQRRGANEAVIRKYRTMSGTQDSPPPTAPPPAAPPVRSRSRTRTAGTRRRSRR